MRNFIKGGAPGQPPREGLRGRRQVAVRATARSATGTNFYASSPTSENSETKRQRNVNRMPAPEEKSSESTGIFRTSEDHRREHSDSGQPPRKIPGPPAGEMTSVAKHASLSLYFCGEGGEVSQFYYSLLPLIIQMKIG